MNRLLALALVLFVASFDPPRPAPSTPGLRSLSETAPALAKKGDGGKDDDEDFALRRA
jgi:hypothetical protein